ncbi:MAG: HAMP domain-containing histidine kinase [Clostridia bacterium]|nr:HAMP domain-containing histidine kinase [Clostridia bacterium]
MALQKVTGITKRWLINGLGTVFVFLALLVAAFILLTRNYYYRGVQSELLSYANSSADLFERYIKGGNFDLESGLRDFVANFQDKEIVEVQLINNEGAIVLTSTGFGRSGETAPDWDGTVTGKDNTASWRGKSSVGENVMSVCVRISEKGAKTAYGLRYVTSLRLVNAEMRSATLAIIAIALAVLFFVMLSNSYFVSTIINPVKEIGRTARNIALGHYDVRIEKRYNDEIGELTDTINYMAGEIATTEQMKNEFISSVSHELRTPLTSIKGWSETLSELGTEDEEMTKKGLKVISGETDRLARIVEDLLDFSRMQSGRFSVQIEKMDLLAEVEDSVMLYRDRAKREGITLKYMENARVMLPIEGDRIRLRQVLVNVIDNAIKYSKSGGTVRVEAAEIGEFAQVVVSDTGIGISDEDLEHITDKFYRAGKNGGIPGSGIGLAVVDEIIKKHNGTLEIESDEGVGTTVIITLPKKQPQTEKETV